MKIDTPDWNPGSVGFVGDGDVSTTKTTTVYEPSEDTFLMLDALELDLECTIKNRLCCDSSNDSLLVVELGCGAGLLTAAMAKVLNGNGALKAHCMAIDLNPQACRVTAETCSLNGVQADIVRGDLLTWMRRRNGNKNEYGPIDLLLFNPPYVRDPEGKPAAAAVTKPTKISGSNTTSYGYQEELDCSVLADAAWLGGGPDGADVLRRSLHQAANLLSERGVFYVLMIDYNYEGLLKDEIKFRNEKKIKRFDVNVSSEVDDTFATIDSLEREVSDDNGCVIFTSFGSDFNNTEEEKQHCKILACRKIVHRKVPRESLAIYKVFRPHIAN